MKSTLTLACFGSALVLASCVQMPRTDAQPITLAAAEVQQPSARALVETQLTPAVVFAGEPTPVFALTDRMARYHVPGVSLTVIRNGKIAWTGGYGVGSAADRDPVRTDTVFQAASLSKPVAAILALKLADQGVLALDQDLSPDLGRWGLARSPSAGNAPVTLRQLLSHTAGVNTASFAGYLCDSPQPSLTQILAGQPPATSAPVAIEYPPDESVRYSGGGYQIVERLIEDRTGQDFAALVEAHLLRPFGMARSGYTVPVGAAASGHGYDGANFDLARWTCYPERAAAGLWTSSEDFARLAIAVAKGWNDQPGGLSAGSVSPIAAAVTENTGAGFGVHAIGDATLIDHAGWSDGYRSYVMLYPQRGDGLVVLANGQDGDRLIEEIRRSAALAYGWPGFAPEEHSVVAVSGETLDRLAGTYRFREAGFPITVTRTGAALRVATPRGSTFTYRATGKEDFVALEDGSQMTIHTDAVGAPVLKLWNMTAERIKEPTP